MATKRRKNDTLSIGSVSSGTMRTEDLIPSFLWEAQHLAPTQDERKQVNAIRKASDVNEDAEYWQSVGVGYDLEALFDILNNHCPPYMYFGSHTGDGADYGVWLSETFEEDFNGLKVSDTSEVPARYVGEVLHFSDHGNLTLYYKPRYGTMREIWGIV